MCMNVGSKLNIVFVGFVNDYELLGIESLRGSFHISIVNIPKIFFRLCKRPILKSGWRLIKYLLISKINKIGNADLVVFKDENDYLRYMNYVNGNSILILRNTVSEQNIDMIKSFSGPIFSFDFDDVLKYGFIHYPQYSCVIDLIRDNKLFLSKKYDFCFIGKNKGRKDFINRIDSVLNVNYKTHFDVISDTDTVKNFFSYLFCFKKNKYSYLSYLTSQLSCDVVLDIVKDNQSSETMRLIEALSSGRKVITNNFNVLNHELYHPQNVLYFNRIEDLEKNIEEFMINEFTVYPSDVINKYSTSFVLNDIISKSIRMFSSK